MAFISMVFAMLGIFVLILFGLGIIGLITIIVSAIVMRKRKKEGKKPRKVGLIIGIIIFLIPVAVILSILIFVAISRIERQIERTQYTCLTDKWRNEWVGEIEAKDEAIETLLKAADEGDVDTIKQMFPQNAQGERLDAQINDFFEEYPQGLSTATNRNEISSSSSIDTFSASYEIVMNGERYYIVLLGQHQSDENPEEVGVTLFTIESEKAYVIEKDYGNSDYIFADTVVEDDFETRRIQGRPYIFTPINRIITQEDVEVTLYTERNISDFIDKYGEPNVIKEYTNSTGTDYIFELESENGEPRYLKIDAVDDHIIIELCYICGAENDQLLWFDENGLLKKNELKKSN